MNKTIFNCVLTENYQLAATDAKFAAYFIITPIYFFFGLFGHFLLLVAFCKQAKKEGAYAYQIFLTLSETIEIISFTLYSSTCHWWSSIDDRGGAEWFITNYRLMQFATHGAVPLVNALITCSLLFSVSMAADRALALWKPIDYQRIDKKKHRSIAVLICVLLAFSTSIFDAFRFYLDQEENNRYVKKLDPIFIASTLAIILANIRNILRLSAFLALIFFNFIVIKLYRQRCVIKNQSKNEHVLCKIQDREKTLVILILIQSITTACAILPLIAFFLIVYIRPTFTTCEGTLMGPINDSILQLAELANFYLILIFSKNLRETVLGLCGARRGRGRSRRQIGPCSVQTINSEPIVKRWH